MKSLSCVRSISVNRMSSRRASLYTQARWYATSSTHKKALLMDANGIIYKRNTKKLAAISDYLIDSGRYTTHQFDVNSLRLHADSLGNLNEEANTGTTNSHQYYMTLLLTLPIHPVDISGAMQAIKRAEYDISLFPGVGDVLLALKHAKGIKIGVVTDSMASTAEKLEWMEKAGLDTSLIDVMVNSSEMGTTKPDPLMYHTALQKLGVSPSEAAFLGHRGSELEGAKNIGLSTLVMFPDPDLLENGGRSLVNYDFYVPSWKHVLDVPYWPSQK